MKKNNKIMLIAFLAILIIIGGVICFYIFKNVNKTTNIIENINSNEVLKEANPSGFAGSSLHLVRLYANGDVYLITYNGEGFSDSNIVGNELLATNAEDIKELTTEDELENSKLAAGAVLITGKNINKINTDYGWIIFENK